MRCLNDVSVNLSHYLVGFLGASFRLPTRAAAPTWAAPSERFTVWGPYTGRRSQGIDSGHSYLRSSKTPQVLSGCPVVADYHRLSVGNTHGSCWGTGHSRWSQACRPW